MELPRELGVYEKSIRTTIDTFTHVFGAPNFEEVEEAYWFGPVHLSVRLSVRYTCTRSRTARDRILKFGMWVEYENKGDL